jgi:hypothetical protein
MSWTYDGNPGDSSASERRDAVRLTIGDTLSTDPQLTDTEIAYYLAQKANNVGAASVEAVKGLIAKYSRAVDTNVVAVGSVSASQRVKSYQALLNQLLADRANVARVAVTGQSKSTNRSYNSDSDRIQPPSRFGQDDFSGGESPPFDRYPS